jgi:hypothetical protein
LFFFVSWFLHFLVTPIKILLIITSLGASKCTFSFRLRFPACVGLLLSLFEIHLFNSFVTCWR